MKTKSTYVRSLLRSALLCGITACGGVTTFQGQSPMSVVGVPPPPPKAEEPPPPPPPPPPARVEVRDNKIAISEKIQFEFNKAIIRPESFGLLDEVASVIKKNSHIKKIAIEGHASAEGDDAHNLKLSDDRAKAVMAYLVSKGVGKDVLSAKGYGETRPVSDNTTPDGREKNRRVEFNIVEQEVTQKKVEVDSSGQEKIVDESKSLVAHESAPVPPVAAGAKDAGAKKSAAIPAPAAGGGAKKPVAPPKPGAPPKPAPAPKTAGKDAKK